MIPLTDSFVVFMRVLAALLTVALIVGFAFAVRKPQFERTVLRSLFTVLKVPYPVKEEVFESKPTRFDLKRELKFFTIHFVEAIIVSGLYLLLVWGAGFLFQHIPYLPHPAARIAYGTFIVVALSAALFKVKISSLRYYAILEGLFSLFVCVTTLAGMGDRIGMGQIGGIFASVYLFIRAADNFKKSMDEAKEPK